MATNQGYTVPFGIDAKNFFDNLNKLESGVDNLQAAATSAIRGIQTSATQASNASEELNKKLKQNEEVAKALGVSARAMGKEIAEALNGKNIGNGFQEKVKAFQQLFAKSNFSKISLDIEFNEDTIREFAAGIGKNSEALEGFNILIQETKEQLAQLDPNTEEFAALSQQLQIAEGFFQGLSEAEQLSEGSSKSLKAQLREMKAQLAEMELAGQGNTEEFRRLSKAAGELEDQIGDVAARVRVLASDTKYIDAAIQAIQGLAGAFAAAQGAVALFGSENEELQKIMVKVQAALALVQGIQAVANALNKDSALSVLLLSKARQADTVAAVAEAGAITTEAAATEGATVATEGFTAALLANPITAILVAITAAVVALVAFTSGSDDAEAASKRFNDTLREQQEILRLDEAALKRHTDLLVAQAKALGKSDADQAHIEKDQLQRLLKVRQQYAEDLRKQYNDEGNRRKMKNEDFVKLGDELLKADEDVVNTENEIAIKGFEEQEAANKKRKEDAKKAVEDAKKSAENKKKINDQVIKFAKELRDAEALALKEGADKQKAIARAQYQDKVDELNKDIALSKEAGEKRSKLLIQLQINLNAQLLKIDQDFARSRAELELQAAIMLNNLREDSLQKEINGIKHDFAQRRMQVEQDYKNEKDLLEILIAALYAAEGKAIKAAKQKNYLQGLDADEQASIKSLDLMAIYSGRSQAVERAKQIKILEIQKNFAELRLKALVDSGKGENDAEVIAAKAAIKGFGDALKKETTAAGNDVPDLFDLISGGKFSDEDKKKIQDGLGTISDAVKSYTDYLIAQYKRQYDAQQKLIDKSDALIGDLEGQLDREKQLRDEGYANNYDRIQKEIQDEKDKKNKLIAIQAEQLEKSKKAQKAQLAVETIVQASSLITAAANIYESYSEIPYVGVALAAGVIAAMFAGFAYAKVKAFEAVNEQQTMAEGGTVRGRSHASGGQKYISADGTGGVVELEAGEKVTNRRMSMQYGELLDAINDGSIGGMSDADLRDLLAGMGIHFDSPETDTALNLVREYHNAKAAEMSQQNENDDLRSIRDDVHYIRERKENETHTWEDDKFTYQKVGSVTYKNRKKMKS